MEGTRPLRLAGGDTVCLYREGTRPLRLAGGILYVYIGKERVPCD